MTKPSFEYVDRLLSYDPQTGIFTRKVSRGHRKKGAVAGTLNKYIVIRIDNVGYPAQDIAWLLYYGEWPENTVDHRDLDKTNNRINNLREATNSQNNYNRPKQTNNTSGYKGVYWNKSCNRWQAYVQAEGKRIHLGVFVDPVEAALAYNSAALKLHGEFARLNRIRRGVPDAYIRYLAQA